MGSLMSYCSDASEGQKRSMPDVLVSHGKNTKRKASALCTISTSPLDDIDNSAAEVAPATVISSSFSNFLSCTTTLPPVTSSSSLKPVTVTLPSVQPPLSSQIVRRAPMPTSTTIQNFRMHQNQQGHTVISREQHWISILKHNKNKNNMIHLLRAQDNWLSFKFKQNKNKTKASPSPSLPYFPKLARRNIKYKEKRHQDCISRAYKPASKFALSKSISKFALSLPLCCNFAIITSSIC